jgi:regulator of RNase E activity RraB
MPLSVLIALGLLGLFLFLRGRAREAAARTGDPDEATLAELARAGSDVAQPHEVEFYLYVPDSVAADALKRQLEGEGFRAQVSPDDSGADWLCLATRRMSPSLAELRRLRSRLAALAEAHGGAYDGWGTTVVGPDPS